MPSTKQLGAFMVACVAVALTATQQEYDKMIPKMRELMNLDPNVIAPSREEALRSPITPMVAEACEYRPQLASQPSKNRPS